MKKITSVTIALCLALSLMACGDTKDADKDASVEVTVDSESVEQASNVKEDKTESDVLTDADSASEESDEAEASDNSEFDTKSIVVDFSTQQQCLESIDDNFYYGYKDKNGVNYAAIGVENPDTMRDKIEVRGEEYYVIALQGVNTSLNLTSFTIPDNIWYMRAGFGDNKSLKNVEFSKDLVNLSDRAFAGCESIEEINVPDTVDTIGEYAFYACKSLKTLTIPDTVTSIGFGAFQKCLSLEKVVIPESVTELGRAAFMECNAITSVGPVGSGASVELPAIYTEISGFSACKSLETVTVPDGVEEIVEYGFNGDPALTTLILPDSLKKIGLKSFLDSPNINSITWMGTEYGSLDEFSKAFTDAGNEYKGV